MIKLSFYNTLTLKKEEFIPANPTNIKMYVCGPTVYDDIHIGNARTLIVFDMLYRLLIEVYGKDNISYVRNITDVDDKIITASKANNETIQSLTTRVSKNFHNYTNLLNCLPPNIEPKATNHITDMIIMIENLINKGYAYFVANHVYFDVLKFQKYGELSHNKLDDLIAGSRVDVEKNKHHPANFVLWKPSEDNTIGWDSPWGYGRPGWHIECSAMIQKYLGSTLDIHAGGLDLIFPHHENERAQSVCSNNTNEFANYWLHNGLLKIDGRKMSKSLGNFITIPELLNKYSGDEIRYALLSTNYREPLDFTTERMEQAKATIKSIKDNINTNSIPDTSLLKASEDFINALKDDLNTSIALRILHTKINEYKKNPVESLRNQIFKDSSILGLFVNQTKKKNQIDEATILKFIAERLEAKKNKDYKKADSIRNNLSALGVDLEDSSNGNTTYKIRQ